MFWEAEMSEEREHPRNCLQRYSNSKFVSFIIKLAKVLHVKYRLFLLGRRKIFPVFKGFIGELARKIEETRLGTNVLCSSVYKVLEIRGTWLKVFYEQSNSAETANLRVQCDEQLI